MICCTPSPAVWAGIVALISPRQSVRYFQLFGAVYLIDGVLGLITGSGCLYGGPDDIELPMRFFANAPHLAIGGL
jgi:hypothetical protein